MKKILIVIMLSLASLNIFAWDGVQSGKVYRTDVTSESNYAFRVTLNNNGASMCGTTVNWAYLNESDSNYDTYLSVILAAFMADRPITIYTTQTSAGYCNIGYISMM